MTQTVKLTMEDIKAFLCEFVENPPWWVHDIEESFTKFSQTGHDLWEVFDLRKDSVLTVTCAMLNDEDTYIKSFGLLSLIDSISDYTGCQVISNIPGEPPYPPLSVCPRSRTYNRVSPIKIINNRFDLNDLGPEDIDQIFQLTLFGEVKYEFLDI